MVPLVLPIMEFLVLIVNSGVTVGVAVFYICACYMHVLTIYTEYLCEVEET